MEITGGFSYPFVMDCHPFYKLMLAHGEGRSPMTSSDAETDSKPIIIIVITMPRSLSDSVLDSKLLTSLLAGSVTIDCFDILVLLAHYVYCIVIV